MPVQAAIVGSLTRNPPRHLSSHGVQLRPATSVRSARGSSLWPSYSTRWLRSFPCCRRRNRRAACIRSARASSAWPPPSSFWLRSGCPPPYILSASSLDRWFRTTERSFPSSSSSWLRPAVWNWFLYCCSTGWCGGRKLSRCAGRFWSCCSCSRLRRSNCIWSSSCSCRYCVWRAFIRGRSSFQRVRFYRIWCCVPSQLSRAACHHFVCIWLPSNNPGVCSVAVTVTRPAASVCWFWRRCRPFPQPTDERGRRHTMWTAGCQDGSCCEHVWSCF